MKATTQAFMTFCKFFGVVVKFSNTFVIPPMLAILLGLPIFITSQVTVLQMGTAQVTQTFISWVGVCYIIGLLYGIYTDRKDRHKATQQ